MEIGVNLPTEEPVELRDRLRVLAAAAPDQVRFTLVDEVAHLATSRVGHSFVDRGTELDVNAVCKGYERELWLWLVGERTWAQCASGLEGRFSRRLKALQA